MNASWGRGALARIASPAAGGEAAIAAGGLTLVMKVVHQAELSLWRPSLGSIEWHHAVPRPLLVS